MYTQSFTELRTFPPIRDEADEEAFTAMLQKIYTRHNDVVPLLALGVAELKRQMAQQAGAAGRQLSLVDMPDIHQVSEEKNKDLAYLILGLLTSFKAAVPPPSQRGRPLSLSSLT